MHAVLALLAVSAEALALAFGHVSSGLHYLQAGQNDKALREFAVVTENYADTTAAAEALYWSAQALTAAGQSEPAAAQLAELARRFPHSPYLAGQTTAKPVDAAPQAAPVVAEQKPAATLPVVWVKKVGNQTVLTLDDKVFATAAAFQAALAELKQQQPAVVVGFRREDDVDLQMVVDGINSLDKAGVAYQLR